MRTCESSSRLPSGTSVMCTTIFFTNISISILEIFPAKLSVRKENPNQHVSLWSDVAPKSIYSEVLPLGIMI